MAELLEKHYRGEGMKETTKYERRLIHGLKFHAGCKRVGWISK